MGYNRSDVFVKNGFVRRIVDKYQLCYPNGINYLSTIQSSL